MPWRLRLWTLAGVVATTACEGGSVDDETSSGPTATSASDGSPTGDPSGTSASDGIDPASDTTLASTTLDASDDDDDDDDDDTSSDVGSSSSTSTSPTTSDDSTGVDHNEACVAGCMVEFGCQDTCECSTMWRSEDACVQWCEANLEEAALFTEFCRDAWEAVSACVGTLACAEYQEFHNPQVPDYPCVSEADALAFECDGQ